MCVCVCVQSTADLESVGVFVFPLSTNSEEAHEQYHHEASDKAEHLTENATTVFTNKTESASNWTHDRIHRLCKLQSLITSYSIFISDGLTGIEAFACFLFCFAL